MYQKRLLDEIIGIKDDIRWRKGQIKELKASADARDAELTDAMLEEMRRNKKAILKVTEEERAQHTKNAKLWKEMRALKLAHGLK